MIDIGLGQQSVKLYDSKSAKHGLGLVRVDTRIDFLDLLLLFLLFLKPGTLYSLQEDFNDALGKRFSFGTLHPHIQKLMVLGLLKDQRESSEEAQYASMPRRYYKITKRGRKTLKENLAILVTVTSHMQRVIG